jgi:glycosyltransferase involved in cell wall biosynthesis
MKVLIVSPNFPPEAGGPAKYSAELLERLPKAGIGVNVLSFTRGEFLQTDLITLVSVRSPFLVRQFNFLLHLLNLTKKADTLLILEPLVVGITSVFLGRVFNRRSVLKFVGDPCWEEERRQGKTSEDLYSFFRSGQHLINWRYWLSFLSLCAANVVITPSVHLKSFLCQFYRIPEDKIKVIYNSVELTKDKVPKKDIDFIFVGRLVPWKNVDLIIKAIKEVDRKLVIVGDGPEEGKLKNLVCKLNLEGKISFLGQVSQEQTQRLIRKSKFLVLSSEYEGLSHVILEAMSGGTVVIASNIPGNDEVVVDGVNGYLFNLNTGDGLSKKLLDAWKLRRLNGNLVKNIHQTLIKQFIWRVNLPKLVRTLSNEV